MNKQKFEQLVKQTGANKCVEFNWSYTLKDSCYIFIEGRELELTLKEVER